MMNEHQQAIRADQEQLARDHIAMKRTLILARLDRAMIELNAAYELTDDSDESMRTFLEWALNYAEMAKPEEA